MASTIMMSSPTRYRCVNIILLSLNNDDSLICMLGKPLVGTNSARENTREGEKQGPTFVVGDEKVGDAMEASGSGGRKNYVLSDNGGVGAKLMEYMDKKLALEKKKSRAPSTQGTHELDDARLLA